MLFAIIPVLVMILGLLMWAVSGNPFVKKIGEWMFVIGLLVSVQVSARVTVSLP